MRAPRSSLQRSDRTHYSVLGIERTADSAQIRAAYVRQLKRIHPDSPNARAQPNGTDVQRLVAAYNILKDEKKRADYDQVLRRPAQGRYGQTPLKIRSRRRQDLRPFRNYALISALILGGAVLGSSLVIWEPARSGSSPTGPGAGVLVDVRSENVPSPARLEPVARLAGKLPVADARMFSERCFERAKHGRALAAADSCVAFDSAFVYWQQSIFGSELPDPYFQPEAMKSRVVDAFARLDADAAMVRAASVRASTFEALLRVVDSTNDSGQGSIPDHQSPDGRGTDSQDELGSAVSPPLSNPRPETEHPLSDGLPPSE